MANPSEELGLNTQEELNSSAHQLEKTNASDGAAETAEAGIKPIYKRTRGELQRLKDKSEHPLDQQY